MTTIKTIAAAALISAAAILPAQAFVSPVERTSDFAVEVLDISAGPEFITTADAALDDFIDRLKSQRDDGTLNEEDYFEIRKFQRQQVASADTVKELIDRLKSQSDDGTLNDQDYFEIRKFQRQQVASVDIDVLARKLKSQRDDGTLNDQDYFELRQARKA